MAGMTGSKVGSNSLDSLQGNSQIDLAATLDGGDRMAATLARYIEGGPASDPLRGGRGNDEIDGNGGNDSLYGEQGKDELDGDAGNDKLFGGPGNDELDGGPGNDVLNGEAGRDWLEGDRGRDVHTGGADADVFEFNRLDGHDTITDFTNGVDRIHIDDFSRSALESLIANAREVGNDLVLTISPEATVTIMNMTRALLDMRDFIL
jgi:Ca2+-binding RTX toxin-like protein